MSLSTSSHSLSSSVSSTSSGFFSSKETDDIGESGTFALPLPWAMKFNGKVKVIHGFEPELSSNESGSDEGNSKAAEANESAGSETQIAIPASQPLAIQIPTQETRPKAETAKPKPKLRVPRRLTMEQLLHPGITAHDLDPIGLAFADNLLRCYDLGFAMLGRRENKNENEEEMHPSEDTQLEVKSWTPDSGACDVFGFSPN